MRCARQDLHGFHSQFAASSQWPRTHFPRLITRVRNVPRLTTGRQNRRPLQRHFIQSPLQTPPEFVASTVTVHVPTDEPASPRRSRVHQALKLLVSSNICNSIFSGLPITSHSIPQVFLYFYGRDSLVADLNKTAPAELYTVSVPRDRQFRAVNLELASIIQIRA